MTFSVGSDPEFFLRDLDGELISAVGLLGGNKKQPRKVSNGSIQEDGVAAEFNSKPAFSLEEFITNHNLILDDLQDILDKKDLVLDRYNSTAIFNEDQLDCDQARQSGCDIDYNAWKVTDNPPVSLLNTSLRAVGGHLHIAFDKAGGERNIQTRCDFVKVLDYQLGVPSILLDSGSTRRKLYGKAGSHRPKFVRSDGFNGVEYRVLSNFWLNNDDLMEFVYSKIAYCNENWRALVDETNNHGEEIQSIINSGNIQDAHRFCNHHEVSYV